MLKLELRESKNDIKKINDRLADKNANELEGMYPKHILDNLIKGLIKVSKSNDPKVAHVEDRTELYKIIKTLNTA